MTTEYTPIEERIIKIKPSSIKKLFGHKEVIKHYYKGERHHIDDYALFTLEEKNKTMTDYALNIEKYITQKRKVKVGYQKKVLDNGFEEIKKIEIKSEDKIIQGELYHKPQEKKIISVSTITGLGYHFSPDSIFLKFNFNSKNPADKEEYLGLVKIVKGIEKKVGADEMLIEVDKKLIDDKRK